MSYEKAIESFDALTQDAPDVSIEARFKCLGLGLSELAKALEKDSKDTRDTLSKILREIP